MPSRPLTDVERGSWLRENRLWILAALLAAATLYSFATIAHDSSQRHVAARLVTRATAERVAGFANDRAVALALGTFEHCGCADTLPALQRFWFDARTGALDVTSVIKGTDTRTPPPAVLAEIARRDVARPERTPPAVHITTQ